MIYRLVARQPAAAPADGPGGFAAALLGHLPRLRRYAVALVGDFAMADDLVQDCVERALKRGHTVAEPQHLYAWLRSILHNLFIDDVRQRKSRGGTVEVDSLADTLALSVPPADRGAAVDLVRAMDGLTPAHREILLMVGLDGMSYREIAEALDLPIGTVMSRIARAREQLRQRLDPAEPAPPAAARKMADR